MKIKEGDIILVYNARNHGEAIGPHPFIVMEVNQHRTPEKPYNYVAYMLSSLDRDAKLEKMLKYETNIPVFAEEKALDGAELTPKDSFIAVDYPYYFIDSKTDYQHVGMIRPECMEYIKENIYRLYQNGMSTYKVQENMYLKEFYDHSNHMPPAYPANSDFFYEISRQTIKEKRILTALDRIVYKSVKQSLKDAVKESLKPYKDLNILKEANITLGQYQDTKAAIRDLLGKHTIPQTTIDDLQVEEALGG